MSMKFTLQYKDPASKARAGELTTDHGVVRTPIFMPVGTAATVKGLFPPRRARRGARPDHPGQHLPPLPPPRYGDHRAGRRRAPLLDVGGADAHRQRRLPGLLAGGVPQTQGGGVPLPLAHRRIEAPVHPRERDRHRADDRRRHHDGIRRVPPGRRAPRLRGQVAGPDRAVARPLLQPLPPDSTQIRPLPGAVPPSCRGVPTPTCGPGRPKT